MVSEIRGLIQTLLKSAEWFSSMSHFGSDLALGFLSITTGSIHRCSSELAPFAGITAILSKEPGHSFDLHFLWFTVFGRMLTFHIAT